MLQGACPACVAVIVTLPTFGAVATLPKETTLLSLLSKIKALSPESVTSRCALSCLFIRDRLEGSQNLQMRAYLRNRHGDGGYFQVPTYGLSSLHFWALH